VLDRDGSKVSVTNKISASADLPGEMFQNPKVLTTGM
jgi:hypothetical protein